MCSSREFVVTDIFAGFPVSVSGFQDAVLQFFGTSVQNHRKKRFTFFFLNLCIFKN